MSPKKKARLAFASALVLLLWSGIAASVTIARLLASAKWVAHSYDVQIALADVQSALLAAARERTSYADSGDPAYVAPYESAKNDTRDKLLRVRQLTSDNPIQQGLYKRMEDLTNRRLALMDSFIDLRRSG